MKPMKNKKLLRIVLWILTIFIVLLVIGGFVFAGMQIMGKNSLKKGATTNSPDLSNPRTETKTPAQQAVEAILQEQGEDTEEEEGDIRFEGETYRYNEDILTFLVLGIDKKGKVTKSDSGEGGQSDAIFLAVMDPHKKKLSLVAINRDTMTDISVYSKNDNYLGDVKGQLALQYAYGDGMEKSCERTVQAVSKLFYGLPIHGYCAIYMGAFSTINDAVGGVDVEVLEDVYESNMKEGQTVHLMGENAYKYIHHRNTDSFNSAGRRLERQKQYLKAFADTAKQQIKKDLTLPVKIYNTVSKYMVTDVSVEEVTYLVPEVLNYEFSLDNMRSVKGETKEGENLEEFCVDEESLYLLILELFYEKIDTMFG